MINGVDGASSLGAGALASALAAPSQQLDREAFLRLLIAQLENQDPLQPQDGAEFVAQLAQFSSLEQVIGINDRLDALTIQNQGLANTEIVGLVEQQVTVRGDVLSSDGSGAAVPVSFSLEGAADIIEVQIRDQSGRTVRTLNLPARQAGNVSVNWDGRGDNGQVQPAGTYRVGIEARTADETPVGVNQNSIGKVQAVSFDRGYPVLHLDTGLEVPVSDLLRVEPSSS
jgi:flagellar basal-body rod modification protein FlgD